jgi:hypothetical protein
MRYQIIECDGKEKLEQEVTRRMEEGWQVQGGVNVVYSPVSGTWWYYQAMVWVEG